MRVGVHRHLSFLPSGVSVGSAHFKAHPIARIQQRVGVKGDVARLKMKSGGRGGGGGGSRRCGSGQRRGSGSGGWSGRGRFGHPLHELAAFAFEVEGEGDEEEAGDDEHHASRLHGSEELEVGGGDVDPDEDEGEVDHPWALADETVLRLEETEDDDEKKDAEPSIPINRTLGMRGQKKMKEKQK